MERREKMEQMAREKERRVENIAKKWSRREEGDFFKTVSSYGVDYDRKKKSYDWTRFKTLAKLEKKSDDLLTEYYKSFVVMCKKQCGAKVDDDMYDASIEQITEEKAKRTLDRLELLSKIREEIVSHPKLDDRLKLCVSSLDLPEWWIPGKHDKDLIIGVAKHGLGRTDYHILNDPELSFQEVLRKQCNTAEQTEAAKDAIKIERHEDILKLDKNEILVQLEKGEGTLKIEKVAMKKEVDESSSKTVVKSEEETKPSVEVDVKVETKVEETKETKEPDDKVEEKDAEEDGKKEEVEKMEVQKEEEVKESCEEPVVVEKEDKEQEKPNEDVEKEKEKEKTDEDAEKDLKDAESKTEKDEAEKPQVEEVEEAKETNEKDAEEAKPEDDLKENDVAKEEAPKKSSTPEKELQEPKDLKEPKDVATKDAQKQPKESKDAAEEDKDSVEQRKADACTKQAAELKAMFPDLEVIQPLSRLSQIDTFVLRDRQGTGALDFSETTVAQLFNNAVKWPKEYALQVRLQHIVYCVENKEWPVPKTFTAYVSGIGPEYDLPIHETPNTPKRDRDTSTPMSNEGNEVITITTDHCLSRMGASGGKKRKRHIAIDVETERAKLHALLNSSYSGQIPSQLKIGVWGGGGGGGGDDDSEDSRRSTPVAAPQPPPAHQQARVLSMPYDLKYSEMKYSAPSKPIGTPTVIPGTSSTLTPIDLSSG